LQKVALSEVEEQPFVFYKKYFLLQNDFFLPKQTTLKIFLKIKFDYNIMKLF